MQDKKDEKVRHTLELARAEVNRQNPQRALQLLRSVQSEVEGMGETSIWAEHQLIFAEAFAAECDPCSENEFVEALKRIGSLAGRDSGLEMRAHEHFGDYLARRRRRSVAREHYVSAKQLAVENAQLEDSARIQLCLIAVDLESDQDPRLASFQNAKKAAKELHCTAQEQLAGWMLYCDQCKEQERGLLAARNASVASVDYFLGVLNSLRKG